MSAMARLVTVFREDETQLSDRELPLLIDDTLTMVLQFTNPCAQCDQTQSLPKEYDRFQQRFKRLSQNQVDAAMMVEGKEVFRDLAQMFPCVGCRRSVERMFDELKSVDHNALDPLLINDEAMLTISADHRGNPSIIYTLFYVHGSKCNEVLDAIPKSKKNKRCLIHSLDTQKAKSTGNWMDIWEALSQECREELVRVENDGLVDTVDNYLRKHRFCTECKAKVMRAYHLLVGEVDCNKEKGYCPALYEGLRCCSGDSAADRHVHVLCDTHYIATLIARAEPELAGSNRSERHAKTIDIAQEEVLTCIGLFLHDRLHKVWQKLRSEEQTWQILFFLGVKTLKKNLEIAMETNEGISQFELVCGEFEEEERVRQQKKMQKRQRKKQRQATKAKGGEIEVQIIEDDIEEEDVTKSGGCEDEAQPKKSSLCHPAVPPVQAVNPSHPDCSAGLHAGCTSCRHTDENDLHIQSCQNCQRLSKTNNNNTYKHNNNIVERDASKRLNGVHTREVPTEAWPLKNAKSILVTPPSPPSCSANLSFCNASPCFASPTCRDHGYFSGQESVCGTPCSSSEGSRSDDHHVGKQAVDGGNCNGCLELEKLNHHQNGRSCGGSGDGNHKHQGHHFHNKVPLKVKNINHQASSYNEGSGDGCRKSECNKSLSKSPLSFDEEEVEQASYCNGHSALNGDHNLSSVNLSGLSLEEMLEHGDEEANCEEEAGHDPPCGISQEDIDLFRLNKHQFEQQRQELRTKLKTQFLNMQLGSAPGSWTCTSCINGVEAQCEGKHDCDAPTDVHACHKDAADHATSGRGKVKVKSPKVKATAGAKPQPAGKVVHA